MHRKKQGYTLSEAREKLRQIGISLKKQDNEYRINFSRGYEATACYETDLVSAVATGQAMAKAKADWSCGYCGSKEGLEEGPDGWSRCIACGGC